MKKLAGCMLVVLSITIWHNYGASLLNTLNFRMLYRPTLLCHLGGKARWALQDEKEKKEIRAGAMGRGLLHLAQLFSFISFFPCKPVQQACAKSWRGAELWLQLDTRNNPSRFAC
jgi:hypothetical protein